MSQVPVQRQSAFRGLIGFARADMTPPVGITTRNWGAAEHDAAEGVHQPLTLSVMALRSGPADEPLILAAIDLGSGGRLGGIAEADNALVRTLGDAGGVGIERVQCSFSHTHAGPQLTCDQPVAGAELLPAYRARVIELARQVCAEALDDCRPALLEWHYGRCMLARNRDLPDPESGRYLTGYNPAGAADETLLVGRVSDPQGEPRVVLVNYACHPTTLAWRNRLISPDWVGSMRELVERHAGAPCMYLQGASGELQPRNAYSGDPAVAERNGRQVGHAALATLADMLPAGQAWRFAGVRESGAPLGVWEGCDDAASPLVSTRLIHVDLPLKADLPTVSELEDRLAACDDRVAGERLRRALAIRSGIGDGAHFAAPIWIWRIGDAVLVGQVNEAYSTFQRRIRAAVADRHVAVMNLVNGAVGYLPPADCYDRDLYTVWQTVFDRGALERCTDVVIEALQCDLPSSRNTNARNTT